MLQAVIPLEAFRAELRYRCERIKSHRPFGKTIGTFTGPAQARAIETPPTQGEAMQMMTTTAAPSPFVPVFVGTIGKHPAQQICDARDLHGTLEVRRDFTNWLKGRIDEYGFEEGEDFSPVLAKTPPENGRPRTDYHLTLDMAKELAMVENNDRGRQVRRYFIACEKRQTKAPMMLTAELAREVIQALQSNAAKEAGIVLKIKGLRQRDRKLTVEQVIEIAQSTESVKRLMERFSVSKNTIYRILGGQAYRDVTGLTKRTNY